MYVFVCVCVYWFSTRVTTVYIPGILVDVLGECAASEWFLFYYFFFHLIMLFLYMVSCACRVHVASTCCNSLFGKTKRTINITRWQNMWKCVWETRVKMYFGLIYSWTGRKTTRKTNAQNLAKTWRRTATSKCARENTHIAFLRKCVHRHYTTNDLYWIL